MKVLLTILLFAVTALARAEVTDSAEGGFSLLHDVDIAATRSEVWQAAVDGVGLWWDPSHTITGDARRMSIDPRPQGCFCEAIGENAGVVHLTVTFVNPGVLLRLTGGLGPLGLLGVDGNMTWEFFDAEAGTRVRFSYVVGGYRPGGLAELAKPVDTVIGEALQRLKAYAETGSPDDASGR